MLKRTVKAVQKERTGHTVSLQERLLQEVIQKKTIITLILVNGFHIRGAIQGYDLYSILIEVERKQQLVYKQAISTIRI